MEDNLREALIEYRDCTLEIIDIIERGELDLISGLVEKRQKMVEGILDGVIDKDKLKQIFNEFRLNELQEHLNSLISNKLSSIKNEMETLEKKKLASNIYNNGKFTGTKIFSKKI